MHSQLAIGLTFGPAQAHLTPSVNRLNSNTREAIIKQLAPRALKYTHCSLTQAAAGIVAFVLHDVCPDLGQLSHIGLNYLRRAVLLKHIFDHGMELVGALQGELVALPLHHPLQHQGPELRGDDSNGMLDDLVEVWAERRATTYALCLAHSWL